MREYTRAEKLACLQRELSLRERVYVARVAADRMTQAQADHEINVVKAIIADYQEGTP